MSVRAAMLLWMFAFWSATVIPIIGVMLALSGAFHRQGFAPPVNKLHPTRFGGVEPVNPILLAGALLGNGSSLRSPYLPPSVPLDERVGVAHATVEGLALRVTSLDVIDASNNGRVPLDANVQIR